MAIESALGGQLGRVGAALDRLIASGGTDAVPRRDAWTAALAGDLPEHGIGDEAVVDEIVTTLVPNGQRLVDPRFWGWITVAPDGIGAVSATAASVAAPQRYLVTAYNLLEEQSLDWLAALCGLPAHMKGVYSSGGSVANLVALGAARQWAYEQRGIDPAADGTGGLPGAIYASAEVHHTVQRSAAVLGLGRSAVRLVDVDDRQRMRPDRLRAAIAADRAAGILPVAVVATAGTTNTGAVDPIRQVGEVAREHGAWFHIDGAYGLLGVLDPRVAGRYDGLALADSAIVDPHKWLGAPVGIAATYVRDRSILFRAFTQEPAPYLESVTGLADADARTSLDAMGIPYSEFAVELSAPSRGAVVWSIIRAQGRDGIAKRIRRDDDHARRLADRCRSHPRLELLAEPELSICCLRYAAPDVADLDAVNQQLLARLHRETPYMPSSTRVNGAFAVRACFINPRTRAEHVDGLADTIVAIGDELRHG